MEQVENFTQCNLLDTKSLYLKKKIKFGNFYKNNYSDVIWVSYDGEQHLKHIEIGIIPLKLTARELALDQR